MMRWKDGNDRKIEETDVSGREKNINEGEEDLKVVCSRPLDVGLHYGAMI